MAVGGSGAKTLALAAVVVVAAVVVARFVFDPSESSGADVDGTIAGGEPSVTPVGEPVDDPSAAPVGDPRAVPGAAPGAEPGDEPSAVRVDPSAVAADDPGAAPANSPGLVPAEDPGSAPRAAPTAVNRGNPKTPWPDPELGQLVGYRDPDCLALYGKTPEQIDATDCGVSSTTGVVAANTKLTACSIGSSATPGPVINFEGSNITLDCVRHWAPVTFLGTACLSGSGCDNITIRRTTMTGSAGKANQLYIRMVVGSGPWRSLLIEKSEISRTDNPIICADGVNGDASSYPGEAPFALVVRDSWIHNIVSSPLPAHPDLIYMFAGCRGVLLERNLIDAADTEGITGSAIQLQTGVVGAGNYTIRKNKIVHWGHGHMINADRNAGSPPEACAIDVHFTDNLFVWKQTGDDTLFNYATEGRECTPIADRPGSSCTGNRFEDGSPALCTPDGS